MWKIGKYEINSKVVLAPMAGITSYGYRKFMSNFGFGVSFSEMVSDMGLIYQNNETRSYVDFPNDILTGVQLFGHDPNSLAEAASIALNINPNINFFDVNMGCPVNKVTKTGAGSELLKNPPLCGEIIKAIKEKTNLPVTAKIRLGIDNKSINFLEVVDELVNNGVDAISIHARTKKQLYSGEPNFDLLKDLGNKIPVPLIVSGNIYKLEDAINALEITKADAVMIARGGIGNPFLLTQINEYFHSGEILKDPIFKEQKEYCVELADYLIKEKGEINAMRIYRGIAPKFFNGFKFSKALKNKLSTELIDKNSLIRIIDEYENQLNNDFD